MKVYPAAKAAALRMDGGFESRMGRFAEYRAMPGKRVSSRYRTGVRNTSISFLALKDSKGRRLPEIGENASYVDRHIEINDSIIARR